MQVNADPVKVKLASASSSVVVEPTVTSSFTVALLSAVTASDDAVSKTISCPAPADVRICPSVPKPPTSHDPLILRRLPTIPLINLLL